MGLVRGEKNQERTLLWDFSDLFMERLHFFQVWWGVPTRCHVFMFLFLRQAGELERLEPRALCPLSWGLPRTTNREWGFGEFWRVVNVGIMTKKNLLSDGIHLIHIYTGMLEFPRTYSFFFGGCSKGGTKKVIPQPEAATVWSSPGGGGVAHGHRGWGLMASYYLGCFPLLWMLLILRWSSHVSYNTCI